MPPDKQVVPAAASAPASSDRKPKWTSLEMASVGLRTVSPALFSYTFLTSLSLSNNHLATLPAAICRLRALTMLDLSANELKVIPPELGLLVHLQHLRLQQNRLTQLPVEFGNLYQLVELNLDGNPLVEPFASYKDRSIVPFLREHRQLNPPGERPWLTSPPNDSDAPAPRGDQLTVLTWNVLADKLATPKQYAYCPEWALQWEHRKGLILIEILRYDADIVCLQEVEGHQFQAFFSPEMRRHGYDGLYRPKARAKTMPPQEAGAVDGCAIFFKKQQFSLLEERVVEFSNLITSRPDIKSAPDLLNRVMPNDNIAVVAKLQHLGTPRRSLLIANVHLTWHPDMTDVRLIQTAMLCDEMKSFAYPHVPQGVKNDTTPQLYPVLLCGDLNALPGSGAHALLARGSIDPLVHPELEGRQYGSAFTAAKLKQPFNLLSTYAVASGAGGKDAGRDGEPPFTNHTPKFSDTLDYIFADANAFETVAALGPVSQSDMKWRVGFPDQHFPSDHVPQVARLKWKLA